MKLCGGLFSSVYRFDGEFVHMVAHYKYSPEALERTEQLFPTRPGRHIFTARAILDRSVIHVPDVSQDASILVRPSWRGYISEVYCRYLCYGGAIQSRHYSLACRCRAVHREARGTS